MCLIFLALRTNKEYPFILVANRDEFYDRATEPAHFWPDAPAVVGGKDLKAGGTWLGVTREGRLGMITNYRDVANLNPHAPSRGHLVRDFLVQNQEPGEYLNRISETSSRYNGFNIMVGSPNELWYHSNYSSQIQTLSQGIFGLSNALLDDPWPKVVRGKAAFAELIQNKFTSEDLFAMMQDETLAKDDDLPSTGLPLDRERALSSMFIRTQGYGTRNTTVIKVHRSGTLQMEERTYLTGIDPVITRSFELMLR